jgi:hypothetical protein
VARRAAAFVFDPDGGARTKALGTQRMARASCATRSTAANTPCALACGNSCVPCSPALVARHRDAFILDQGIETPVALAEHGGESGLDDLRDDDELDPRRIAGRAIMISRPPA